MAFLHSFSWGLGWPAEDPGDWRSREPIESIYKLDRELPSLSLQIVIGIYRIWERLN